MQGVVLNPSEGMCLHGVLSRFMTGNTAKRRPCEPSRVTILYKERSKRGEVGAEAAEGMNRGKRDITIHMIHRLSQYLTVF